VDVVQRAWASARQAWPDVDLPAEAFAARVAAVEPAALEQHGNDLYLAAACERGDRAAISVFERELVASGRPTVQAIDSNGAFVDDALQKLRASLLVGDDGSPRIAQYAGRGPLRAWLGIAAARIALTLRRSQQRKREVSGDDDWSGALATIATADPELELLKQQYAVAFTSAMRDAVAALEPRARTILRMSFVEALSIDDIGAIYAVHRATSARWIQRACEQVFEKTRELLAERLALSHTEMDRMNALVRSQLDVSLSQLLPSIE
jgi:RNA polymerase sigma-70 factor, ECF subfamily